MTKEPSIRDKIDKRSKARCDNSDMDKWSRKTWNWLQDLTNDHILNLIEKILTNKVE